MNRRQEIANRWLRVFEQNTKEAQEMEIQKLLPYVVDDLYYLLTELKENDNHLAQSISGISSRWGQVVTIKDGILHYRINGQFVDIDTLADALRALNSITKTESIEKKARTKVDLDKIRGLFEEK